MIVAESPSRTELIAPAFTSSVVHGARDLARLYDLQMAASWRGDAAAVNFFTWLAAQRCDAPAPASAPAAISPHGAGGRGITWYDAPDAVIGYIPGAAWGYSIPHGAELPAPRLDARISRPAARRLRPDEIEAVLRRQHLGRLACPAEDLPDIVPVTYIYAGGDVYGYALPSRKVAVLRTAPHASFTVQERIDGDSWQSVVAEGAYEELTDPTERRTALALLRGVDPSVLADAPGVVFRLRLTDKTGRVIAPAS